jgi:hypothetical protein
MASGSASLFTATTVTVATAMLVSRRTLLWKKNRIEVNILDTHPKSKKPTTPHLNCLSYEQVIVKSGCLR